MRIRRRLVELRHHISMVHRAVAEESPTVAAALQMP
jgi:hypothetical protein